MKKLLLALLLTAVVSGSAVAQPPPVAYVGLYVDDLHSTQCISGSVSYEFLMWIWVLPGVDGLYGVEFAMEYPPGVIPSTVERNPIFPAQLGDLTSVDGVATSASECLEDWTWVFRQNIIVTAPDPMEIRIVGSTMGEFVYETPIHTTCDYPYPIFELRVLNYLYINYEGEAYECSLIGTESKSWGAIKSLFR